MNHDFETVAWGTAIATSDSLFHPNTHLEHCVQNDGLFAVRAAGK